MGSGAGACLTLLALVILRLKEHPAAAPRIQVGHRLMQTAVPLALGDVLKSGINTAENLMVPKRLALYAGVSDPLAAFGTVCGMVFPVLMFPAAILFGLAELLIPELARCNAAGSRERITYLATRSLRVAMLYGCTFAALLFLLAEPLCTALYDSSEAGHFLRLFSVLIPMLYCDAITDAMVKGLGQQTASVRYNILTSFLDVVFLYLLLPRYGMTGYFFSFLVTHLLNFVLSLGRLLRTARLSLDWQSPLLTLTASVAAVWAASYLPSPLLQGAGCLVILGCLLFLFKVLKREDILWVKGLICKK